MDIWSWLSKLVHLRSTPVPDDIIIRLRWFLLFMAILAIYIGLQMGDDWYVKDSATYDWARGLGY